MLKVKFDFDSAWERANALLAHHGLHSEDVLKALVLREAAVVRMANAPFWSEKWHKASKDVADQDEVLAKWGLA